VTPDMARIVGELIHVLLLKFNEDLAAEAKRGCPVYGGRLDERRHPRKPRVCSPRLPTSRKSHLSTGTL